MFYRTLSLLLVCLCCNTHAQAETTEEEFIDANILTIFYHELGHALIDVMNLPIYGQEEDAADVLSVLMIDWYYEEEVAQSIAYDSAFGYITDAEETGEATYWGLHGPDRQRLTLILL